MDPNSPSNPNNPTPPLPVTDPNTPVAPADASVPPVTSDPGMAVTSADIPMAPAAPVDNVPQISTSDPIDWSVTSAPTTSAQPASPDATLGGPAVSDTNPGGSMPSLDAPVINPDPTAAQPPVSTPSDPAVFPVVSATPEPAPAWPPVDAASQVNTPAPAPSFDTSASAFPAASPAPTADPVTPATPSWLPQAEQPAPAADQQAWGSPVDQSATPAPDSSNATGFNFGGEQAPTTVPTFVPPASEPTTTPAAGDVVGGGVGDGLNTSSSVPNWSGGGSSFGSPLAGDTSGQAGLTDSAPTDLSHLVNTPENGVPSTPAAPQAEPVVVTQAATPDTNQVVTGSNSGGIPKWALIAGGVILLLIVAGASAYFILGVGKPAQTEQTENTAPIEEQVPTIPPQTLVPTEAVPPVASGAANFGSLSNASPSPSVAGGTSALDRLRQRQAQNP